MSSATGCLVLSTPTYDNPQQTPPTLIADAANPAINHVVFVTPDNPGSLTFTASVLSQDNAHDPVKFVLDVDYGLQRTADGPPFAVAVGQPDAPETHSLDDGPQPTPSLVVGTQEFFTPGICHTVTLFATHALNGQNSGCPRCLRTDSSSLTWSVILCPSGQGTSCPAVDLTVDDCAVLLNDWTAACPAETDPSICPLLAPTQ